MLLGITGILCAVSLTSSWIQLRAAREQVSALEQRLATVETRAPNKPIDRVAVVRQDTMVSAAIAPNPASPSAAPAEQPPRPGNREFEMLKDPAYRRARAEAWRRQHAQAHADAIRVVGLTREQADKLIDLTFEQNVRLIDLKGSGDEYERETFAADLKRHNEQNEAQQRELRGDEKYEAWHQYQVSTGERQDVRLLRAQLSTTAEPLQDRQADALVKTLFSERRRINREFDEYA